MLQLGWMVGRPEKLPGEQAPEGRGIVEQLLRRSDWGLEV